MRKVYDAKARHRTHAGARAHAKRQLSLISAEWRLSHRYLLSIEFMGDKSGYNTVAVAR